MVQYMGSTGWRRGAPHARLEEPQPEPPRPDRDRRALRSVRGLLPHQDDGRAVRGGCARNLMLAPINTAREILASPQLAARNFLVDVEYRAAGSFAILAPSRSRPRRTPTALASASPALRRSSASTRSTCWPSSASAQPRWPLARGGHRVTGLFAGTTFLEFGGVRPTVATRYFADHGATVIRVESRQRPDFLRVLRLTPTRRAARRCASLRGAEREQAVGRAQPRASRGVAVARRLALWADVVAENFAPARWRSGGSTTPPWCGSARTW